MCNEVEGGTNVCRSQIVPDLIQINHIGKSVLGKRRNEEQIEETMQKIGKENRCSPLLTRQVAKTAAGTWDRIRRE